MSVPAEDTANSPARAGRSGSGRLTTIVRLTAVGYLIALLVVALALRFVGERWWVTTIALYLPPIGWGLPLPFLVAALLIARSYWFLLTQLGAMLVVLFPLMGLSLSGPQTATPGMPRFRILTLNIGLGENGVEDVLDRIRDAQPDVIVLEEVAEGNVAPLRVGLPSYAFEHLDQFVVASRFPIDEAFLPPPVEIDGELHSRHYARFRLLTPGGPIRLFATHPVSPHGAFDRIRGEGLRDQILRNQVFGTGTRGAMAANTRQRLTQISMLAEDAADSAESVVIAGDTNLPGPSWARARWLGGYQDAFAVAGLGFGYTYPAQKRAWMRIDRILAGARLRFLDASPVYPRVLAQLAVVADLEFAPP